MANEHQLVARNLPRFSNVVIAKRAKARFLMSKLTTLIVRWISETEIYLYFHAAAALLKVVRLLLE